MRILFITATRVGDAVLSTGLLTALVERHPGARLTIVVGRPAAPLFGTVPGVERVLIVDKQPLRRHWLRLWRQVAGQRWDLVVDLRASGLGYLLRARRRLGIRRRDDASHRVVEVGRLLDPEAPPPAPRVWLAAAHERLADSLIGNGPPVLALGPTANWAGKVWPAEHFAELAAELTGPGGPLPGGRVAVLGAKHERLQAPPLLRAVPRERLVDLVGRVELPVAAACLQRCALYVGNDSGLMHLAAAAGTPTLGLFGPSPEWRYHPWGDHCAWVRTPQSFEELAALPGFPSGPDCLMQDLTVATVVAAARALWQRVEGGADLVDG